jgi:hypothetical protein
MTSRPRPNSVRATLPQRRSSKRLPLHAAAWPTSLILIKSAPELPTLISCTSIASPRLTINQLWESTLFFLFRLVRNSSHPALKWVIAALLVALGVALIGWGLLDHSSILAIRGVLELVIVAVFVLRVARPGRLRGGGGPNRLP